MGRYRIFGTWADDPEDVGGLEEIGVAEGLDAAIEDVESREDINHAQIATRTRGDEGALMIVTEGRRRDAGDWSWVSW